MSAGILGWLGLTLIVRVVFSDVAFTAAIVSGIVLCGVLLGVHLYSFFSLKDALGSMSDSSITRPRSERTVVAELAACVDLLERMKRGENVRLVSPYVRWYYAQYSGKFHAPEDQNKKSQRDVDAMMFFVNKKFKETLLANPRMLSVRLIYVSFLLYHAGNYILAWEVNEGSAAEFASVIQQVHIRFLSYQSLVANRCRKKLRHEIARGKSRAAAMTSNFAHDATNMANLEPLEMTIRTAEARKACELIEQNSGVYVRLWDALQDSIPDYDRFHILGLSFLDLDQAIKKVWKSLQTATARGHSGCVSARFVWLYASYAEKVLHDEKRAASVRELLERPEILVQEDTLSQYIGPGNAVLGVSANLKSLGRIKTFNAAACELLGYSKNELKDLPLTRLIPPIYREMHEQVVQQQGFLANMSEPRVEMMLTRQGSFALHSSKYLVPVSLQIVDVPNYTNKHCFLVRLKKSVTEYDVCYLLADNEGFISSVSSSTV